MISKSLTAPPFFHHLAASVEMPVCSARAPAVSGREMRFVYSRLHDERDAGER